LIVIEVELNGKRVARAGAKDMGVLGAHVGGVGKLGPHSGGTKSAKDAFDLDLWVGGMTSRSRRPDEHLRWGGRRQLKIGDEVVVRILQSTQADPPNERSPASGKRDKRSERERFEFAKVLYYGLRKKFERRRLTARSTATRRKRRAR
jgi:hypothetical protein